MAQAVVKVDQFAEVLADRRLISQFNGNRRDREETRWTAEKQFALDIIRGNEALQRCDPESLRTALMDVAHAGLSLAPMRAHAYLIPYDGLASFKPGYRGLLHLVHKAETIKACQPALVYERDAFRVATRNNKREIHHEEVLIPDRGNVTHAYTITTLHNGEKLIDVVDAVYLKACEAASRTKNPKGGMVWRHPVFRHEMEVKSAIRHAWKYWPHDKAGNLAHAIDVANRHEPADFEKAPDTGGGEEGEACLTKEQVREMHAWLTDRAVKDPDDWLQKLAEAMGSRRIEHLPARRFEEGFNRVKDRYERWRAANAEEE